MATATTALDAKIGRTPGKLGILVFGLVLLGGVAYAGAQLLGDLVNVHSGSVLPFVFWELP